MHFPPTFTWGVAAAACQIEGAADADGKGPSVWDHFAGQSGNVALGHTPAIACDHYHRFREDVAIMRSLGIQAYRLSLSWPRILPAGTGAPNPAGLAFYDRLIDALLEASITPWVTLFHWDFPLELFYRGGWLNRDSVSWFADYAAFVADAFSDRVRHWITLNEPQCFLGFGHLTGSNAPGLRLPLTDVLRAGHHVLLAHGAAVQALRAHSSSPVSIGWAPVGIVSVPDDPNSPADIAAARSAMAACCQLLTPSAGMTAPVWSNSWWADPVVLGCYPEDGMALAGAAMPHIRAGDMELISQPIDFYGANIYSAQRIRASAEGLPVLVPHHPGTSLSAFKWPIVPECLRWGPVFLHERYQLPVVLTENGISLADAPSLDGGVHDPVRIDFLDRHLEQLSLAIDDHAEVSGYFHWSILDNFEWAEGYQQRFGLVHVDYASQQRTPKDSAYHYADIIRRTMLQAACD